MASVSPTKISSLNENIGYNCAYAFKQPTTPEEEKLCAQALHCCPVEAITNDGDLLD